MDRVSILHDEPGLVLAETEHGIVACRSLDELLVWESGFDQFLMTPEQSAELVELMRCSDRVSRDGASVQEREALEERRAAFHRTVAGLDER
jgi:hypothetical protein